MRRAIVTLLLLAVVITGISAQTAVVEEFSGKVEYRIGNGGWQPVQVGLEIPLQATISTGFGATAVLSVASSQIQVAQLTRLSIEELADNGETVSTGVFVPVGRVRASVQQPPNRSTDFRIRTAQSTAAVRGTEFETDGWQVAVSEGIVEFANLLAQSQLVGAGETSSVADGQPTDPFDELNSQANIGDGGGPGDFEGGPAGSGYITVRWGGSE
jgi:hypothetical protein